MLRLYTFNISHFSEKARWALDFNGLDYTERSLLPGLHMARIKRIAPETTVPTLEHDGGVVQGSGAILDHIEHRLGATRLAAPEALKARCAELEALADHAFGFGIQRIFYGPLLADRATITRLWNQGGPWWGGAFYGLAFPFIAGAVRRMYGIRPEKVAKSRDAFRRAMDTTDQALAQSPGPSAYLLGTPGPTRADTTVAALLAPMCNPPEHRTRWPELPGEIAEFKAEFAGRPTVDFVLRMYREHRRGQRPATIG